MKKCFTAVINAIFFILGLDGHTRRKAVDDGLCDFSGQGRDRYGK